MKNLRFVTFTLLCGVFLSGCLIKTHISTEQAKEDVPEVKSRVGSVPAEDTQEASAPLTYIPAEQAEDTVPKAEGLVDSTFAEDTQEAPVPLKTAVLYFENVSKDESLKPLERIIRSQFKTYLEAQQFTIVERSNLEQIIDELFLSQSKIIDPDTRLRLRQLFGAEALFYGGFFLLNEQLYVNGHLYRVETAELIDSLSGHCRHDAITPIRDLAKNMSNQIISSLANPPTSDVSTVEQVTVAVLPFDIVSKKEKLKSALSVGFIDLFNTALSKSPHLKIVERRRLNKTILKEIELNQSAMIDPTTVQRWGKILSAQLLFYGEAIEFGGEFQLHGRLIRTVYGVQIKAAEDIYDSDELPEKLPELVEDISKEILDHVGQIHPKLRADILYHQGKNYEERKAYDKARESYERALEEDEDHEKAFEALANLILLQNQD